MYGAASLLALVLSIGNEKFAEAYDLAERFASPTPILTLALSIVTPLLFIACGLLGLQRANRPNSASICIGLGLVLFSVVVLDIIHAATSGLASGVPEISTYILLSVLSVLYSIGAWRNRKQKEL